MIYLHELFPDNPIYSIQKWYIWVSFQTSSKEFCKLREAIWRTTINEICKFQSILNFFYQTNFLLELSSSYPITQFKNDTFDLVSTLLERDFANYIEVIWLPVSYEISF